MIRLPSRQFRNCRAVSKSDRIMTENQPNLFKPRFTMIFFIVLFLAALGIRLSLP